MRPFLKFILSLIALIACCAIVDCLIGVILDKMIDKVPNDGNEIAATHYAIKRVNDPVLILGSSRAKNHYYPDIISDSLSVSVYNLGRPGHYISYTYCLINSILDRYTPEIVIWELEMDSLFLNTDEDRANSLKPYYWDSRVVQEVINEKEGVKEKVRLLSNAYRYNGIAIDILYSCLKGGPDVDPLKGMIPAEHTDYHVNPILQLDNSISGDIDQARVKRLHDALKRLIDAGVKVYVFDSPVYFLPNPDRNLASESIIREECEKLSVPIFDNRYLDYFLQHPELFRDNSHLYEDGAEKYSQLAAHQIIQAYLR